MNNEIVCIIKIGDEFFKGYIKQDKTPATVADMNRATEMDYKTALRAVDALRWFHYQAEVMELNF